MTQTARWAVVVVMVLWWASCGDSAAPVQADAAVDLPGGLALGQACSKGTQCTSGSCADGLCCDTACEGTCIACNVKGSEGACVAVPSGDDIRGDCAVSGQPDACKGTCDGNRACVFPKNTVQCGAECVTASGVEDKVKRSYCDGAGSCVASATDDSCGGFTCTSGTCETSCDTSLPCTGTVFQCVGGQCVADQPNGAPCGTNDKACKSGHCADMVCCDTACDGTCEGCNSSGTCTPFVSGTDPDGECVVTGQPSACAGKCNGASGCTWPTAECDRKCGGTAGAPLINVYSCSQGRCSTTPTGSEDCKFTTCSNNACPGDCATKSDCVSGSVCDRTAAHTSGRGACVDPAKIETVASGLNGALSGLASGKTHVVLTGAQYLEKVAVPASTTVTIIGDNATPSRITAPGTSTGPALTINAGATVALQNVKVDLAQNPAGIGINCAGAAGNQATLTVVESTVSDNKGTGIDASRCDVVLRRNTINNNNGGGVSLVNGTFTLVNNAIVKNAVAPSVGGVSLTSPGVGSVFAYNTLSDNAATGSGTSGLLCNGPVTLTNNIVRGNLGGAAEISGTCTFTNSNITGGTGTNIDQNPQFVDTATDNYSLKTSPPSPCINAGTTSPTGGTVIDIANGPRKKGASTDMGAYEVQ